MPRKRKPPFAPEPGAPPPLEAQTTRRVRFEETDPLNIVWHGRYPSYLEDARAAFGEKFGLGYLDMVAAGYIAPIVQMHIDYRRPLEFDQTFVVTIRAHWSEAARLNFEYRIVNAQGEEIATAHTVQMLLDLERQILLVWPLHLEAFRQRWKEGSLK